MSEAKILSDQIDVIDDTATLPLSDDISKVFTDALEDSINTDFGPIDKSQISIDANGRVVINDAGAVARIVKIQSDPGINEINVGQCFTGIVCL